MNEPINKIITSINKIDTLSHKIIIHGLQIAIALLISALILSYINKVYFYKDFSIFFMTINMTKTGVILFAEAIIGGLVVDYLVKKQDRTK